MLLKGRLDAYCDDELAIAELFRRAGYPKAPFKKVMPLKDSDFYFAFSRGTSLATMTAWSDALIEIKRSGEFKRLYQKWFGDLQAPEKVELLHPGPQLNHRFVKTPDERPGPEL